MQGGWYIVAVAALASCGAPVSPERAAERCEKRARAAQGPTGGITVGTNTKSGGFASAEIGVSTDFLDGRDPLQVYDACIIALTGEAPIRPPVLNKF